MRDLVCVCSAAPRLPLRCAVCTVLSTSPVSVVSLGVWRSTPSSAYVLSDQSCLGGLEFLTSTDTVRELEPLV